MDAIRLRQIEEVMGYENHINTMVFDMERKRVSQTIRERPEDEYAMIDAQKMMDVNDAANALQLMLDGKLGNLSVMARNSTSVDSTQFGYAAKDVWEVEDVVAKYNEISALFVSAGGATALQQNILRRAHELLRPVGAIKNGVNKVLNNITRMIGGRDDENDALSPTLSFYFVRLAETLAAYVMLYEHIRSSRLLPITPSDLATRVWDLINHKKAWRDIAGRKNVERLFREFDFPAPPARPPPERPTIKVKAGIPTLDPPPGGAGPLPPPAPRENPQGAGPLPIIPVIPPGGGPPGGGPMLPPGGGPPGGGPPGGGPLPLPGGEPQGGLPPPGRPNPQGGPWLEDQPQPRGPRGPRGPRRRQFQVGAYKRREQKLYMKTSNWQARQDWIPYCTPRRRLRAARTSRTADTVDIYSCRYNRRRTHARCI